MAMGQDRNRFYEIMVLRNRGKGLPLKLNSEPFDILSLSLNQLGATSEQSWLEANNYFSVMMETQFQFLCEAYN